MGWRCLVCGHKLDLDHRPEACPHCGVDEHFIVAESDYARPSGTMSEASRASFLEALDLEITATRIYHDAAAKAKAEGDEVTRVFFAGLARNEFGHQKAIKYQLRCRSEGLSEVLPENYNPEADKERADT